MEKPLALSYKDSSSFAPIISSCIVNPTLYDGVFEYGSKIILSLATSTKEPRIKYTPLDIPTALPTYEESNGISVAILSPAFTGVFPYTNDSSVKRFSPSSREPASLLVPDVTYLIKRVISVISFESEGNLQSSTYTTTPEFCPFSLFPFKFSRYNVTGSPK